MFTYIVYRDFLSNPDTFWDGTHIASLWAIAILMDLMLLLVVAIAANAVRATGGGERAADARAWLGRLAKGMAAVDSAVFLLAGLMLAGLVCVTFFSVLGRTFLSPIPDDITFSEWFLVALVALMLGTIQGREDHIEVTVVADAVGHRLNLYFRILGVLIGLFAVGRLGLVAFEEVPDSFLEITYGSIYELPAWPPRAIFMVGVAWWFTRIAIQAVLLPVLVADDRRDPDPRFGPYPLISHTGRGEEVDGKSDPGPLGTEGGARGA